MIFECLPYAYYKSENNDKNDKNNHKAAKHHTSTDLIDISIINEYYHAFRGDHLFIFVNLQVFPKLLTSIDVGLLLNCLVALIISLCCGLQLSYVLLVSGFSRCGFTGQRLPASSRVGFKFLKILI